MLVIYNLILLEAMGKTKKAKITFTCTHELREKLENIATAEDRTLSNLVERIVTKALEYQDLKED